MIHVRQHNTTLEMAMAMLEEKKDSEAGPKGGEEVAGSSGRAGAKVVLPQAWALTYAAASKEEMSAAYARWADTYDDDSINTFGYKGPDECCALLNKHAAQDTSVRIVDIGAGTGLVGTRLHALGYEDLTGIDLSPDMLRKAADKKVYKYLYEADLNCLNRMTHKDNEYDIGVAVGTFTTNHCGIAALLELIRIVKPNGMLFMSLRDDYWEDTENGFREEVQRLIDNSRIYQIEVTSSSTYTPAVSSEITFRCRAYRVLE